MGKTFKKILCSLLVVVMCLTSAPLQGFVGMEWLSLPEINFGEFELPKIDFSSWFDSKASAAETLTYGDFKYVVNDDGTIAIIGYTGTSAAVTLPNQINGAIVTSIGREAFSNCTALKEIELHEGIVSFGSSAFRNCDSLTEIVIPSTLQRSENSEYVNPGPFEDCDNLVKVTFAEGSTSVVDYLCRDIPNLKSVVMPKTVEYIGREAF